MVAAGNGPAALLFGGGRASLGGEPLDEAGARRYRELTAGRRACPTYVLPGPGDRRAAATRRSRAAFADAPAPQGTRRRAPDGVDAAAAAQPESAEARRRGASFAFDVRAAAGTVRVVAIDNAAGRLAGGPDGAAGAAGCATSWSRRASSGIPVDRGRQRARWTARSACRRADDADDELALLAGHASAYVATAGVDDPHDPHFGGVLSQQRGRPPGAAAPLAVFQSSTLGYAPSAVDRRCSRTQLRRGRDHPPDHRGAADDRRRRRPARRRPPAWRP